MVKFSMKKKGEYRLDVTGYTCPYPVIYLKKALSQLKEGDILEVVFDNPPSCETIPEAVREEGHEIIDFSRVDEGLWRITVKRR